MDSTQLQIRDATHDDMSAVQRIYASYVLNSTATFEEKPPDVAEMQSRYEHVRMLGLPYLVGIANGVLIGYCYAAPYRPRIAHRYTIENSIYLAEDQTGKRFGGALLEELIKRCERGPWRQMIAVIAGGDNVASIALHRRLGFRDAGTQPSTGYKFGQWIDVVFMQRALGAGDSTHPTE
ncbi:MAG TPA: GNAT family N-acetyltransferase [Paralcaligenes sp.]